MTRQPLSTESQLGGGGALVAQESSQFIDPMSKITLGPSLIVQGAELAVPTHPASAQESLGVVGGHRDDVTQAMLKTLALFGVLFVAGTCEQPLLTDLGQRGLWL